MKIKITSFFEEHCTKALSKKICCLALCGVMALSLVGCGGPSISERNQETYELESGETYFSSYQSHFSDDDLHNLPDSIETINLDYAVYLSDLSDLTDICPNLNILN